MADITCCSGNDCPVKETCYRFTAPKSLVWQSYFMEPPFEIKDSVFTCEMYWGRTQDHVLEELARIMKIR